MKVYLDDFFNANDRNLDFVLKIHIFSETISSGRTYTAIWGIKHYLTLSVELIQGQGWIIFKHYGIIGEFFQDLCGIPIESHWNYQGIQM